MSRRMPIGPKGGMRRMPIGPKGGMRRMPIFSSYYEYVRQFYKFLEKSDIFLAAWEDMREVDVSEIERTSNSTTQYGKLQYPNGETNGVIIPNSVTSIGDYAFYGWTTNTEPLVIPNSVSSVGEYAFRNWATNNQPLVIPNSVTSIDKYGFYGWSANNQPLVISNSVSSIKRSTFAGWTSNNHPLVIPNSVTSLEESTFSYWTSNNHPIVIPNSVSSIANYVFYNWSKVPYVIMESETPPTLSSSNAFDNQNDAPIYVPDESVTNYKNATNWSALADRIFSINDK